MLKKYVILRKCFSVSFMMKRLSAGRWKYPRDVGNKAPKLQRTVPFIVVETDEKKSMASVVLIVHDAFYRLV
jgi:hypothetical protein